MNRVILIGNGFDLAHKMRTSYKDFIENYLKLIIQELQQRRGHGEFENDVVNIVNIPGIWEAEYSYKSLKANLNKIKSKILFKNKFLEIISNKTSLHNWVDIESEYYELIKEIVNKPSYYHYNDISKLNKDFEKIKNYLEEYLVKIEQNFFKEFRDPFIKREIGTKIYSSFGLKDFTEEIINKVAISEFNKIEKRIKNLVEGVEQPTIGGNIIFNSNSLSSVEDVKKMLLTESANENFDLIPNQIIFLNFNYTSTPLLYNKENKYLNFPNGLNKEVITELINIHGELKKFDNPIIFGYGDEIDKNYKKIEELNDNKYLHNIKSIRYLETDNYKRLLKILDDDFFQIFIFGHSCGISDRTLLNTIFEHPNCGSIKLFYCKENEKTDNFSDIARNISRNFNNKSIMRERVVNKTYCKPLIE